MPGYKHDSAEHPRSSGSPNLDDKAQQSAKVSGIRDALVAADFDTLSAQASALGLSRSTTWALLNGRYKASGISAAVVRRILNSRTLPLTVRRLVENYVNEKLLGVYGHSEKQRMLFRMRLEHPIKPKPPA